MVVAAERVRKQRLAAELTEVRQKLRHTFKAASGDFSFDAILVKVDGHNYTVKLLRVDTGKAITVDTNSLSDDDRRWITSRVPIVRSHGAAIIEDTEKQQLSPAASTVRP